VECKNCESVNISRGLTLGNLGPKYKVGIFIGVEQMYIDVCEDCGEIVRFYIKPKKQREWYKKRIKGDE
jgi:hypothetical protein